MKKKISIKRVFGLFLAMLVMVGTISAQVLAAPTWGTETEGSLTINKTDQNGSAIAGAGYTLYKVADVVQSGAEMSYDTSAYTHGVTVTGSTTAADFSAAAMATLTEAAAEQITDGTNDLVFSSLPLGVYLVKETTTPDGVIASNDFIVSIPMTDPVNGDSWVYDVTAEPKNSVFTGSVSKTVISGGEVEGSAGDKTWTVNVGEEVTYKITVTMPTDFYGAVSPATAKNYTQFDIYDMPSAGLQIDVSSVEAKVGSTVVAAGAAGTPTTPSNANGFTVSLVNAAKDGAVHADVVAGATVEITYKATITKEGVGTDIKNAAKIKYDYIGSEGPGTQDPDPDDPDPTLHTYSHAVLKVTDDKTTALNGAGFIVKLSNGNHLKLNSTSDGWTEVANASNATVFTSGSASPLTTFTANGYFAIIGVKGGTHQIIETKAPTGYTLLKSPVNVTFDSTSTATQKLEAADQYSTKVVNAKGFTLPGTGGAGIVIYIAAGILLVAIGLLLYAKRRSMAGKN